MLNNRYEFVMIFDVENGNPNGDPDAGNSPRVDAETGHGYITDVCIKRKIRNYVELVKEGIPGYNILIKPDRSLNSKFASAYQDKNIQSDKKTVTSGELEAAREYMCQNYFDVRVFGAVMSTGDNPCGIVRGPVQISFAKSISPINIDEVTITRQAKTTDERAEASDTEIGRKHIIPYALYRAEGYVSAALANKTFMTEADLNLLWEAIINLFEHDRSAARGKMALRKLIVFKHRDKLGNCPAHLLFEKIQVSLKEDVDVPRRFSDYEVVIDSNLPEGVSLEQKI